MIFSICSYHNKPYVNGKLFILVLCSRVTYFHDSLTFTDGEYTCNTANTQVWYTDILASPGVSVLVGQTHSAGGGGVPEEPPGWGRRAVQGSDSRTALGWSGAPSWSSPLLAVITRQRCKQVSGGALCGWGACSTHNWFQTCALHARL